MTMTPKFTDTFRYPNGYTRSLNTDIRRTFRRIEAERRRSEAATPDSIRSPQPESQDQGGQLVVNS